MRWPTRGRAAAIAIAALIFGACKQPSSTGPAVQQSPRYLFTWVGDEDRDNDDFIAVIDLARHGDRYGTIVATTPAGEKALWPHHTEHELGPSGMLFANGYAGNRSILIDLHDPLHPRIAERFSGAGELSFIHSFVRLPNGHVLATTQGHGLNNAAPGGLVELDEHGRVLRSRSAADPNADQTTLRPYSLAVVPSLDRVVVTLTYMPIPTWSPYRASIEHDHSGNQIQVYRLSDLSLIKTIRLLGDDSPNEPRVLKDGRSVLVASAACRFYRVTRLAGSDPGVELVHAEPTKGCGGPVLIGDVWVQSHAADHRVFSLDVSDPAHIRGLSSVSFDDRQRPHWLASDGTRIVVVNEPGPTAERRIWMLRLDHATGRLSLDSTFRDAGSVRPGIAFDRTNWPHGSTGSAVPHGTVFSR